MKKILLVSACFLIFTGIRGQNINPDSLIKLALSIRDSTKTRSTNPDSVLKTMFLIKSPAERIRLVYDIILLDNGELKIDRALYYHHKILDEAKKHNDLIVESVITGELGYIEAENGDYATGFKMLLQALDMAKKSGNKQAIGIVYDNMGVCYQGNGYTRMAYFKKAYPYSIGGGDFLFAPTELANIALGFFKLNRPDSANYYILRSLDLAIQKKQVDIVQFDIIHLGVFQPNVSKKIGIFRAALSMPISQHNMAQRSVILARIAEAYQLTGASDSALYYARSAYITGRNDFISKRLEPLKILAAVYKGRNADSALKYTEIYYTLRDSLFNIDKAQRAQSLAFADQQRQQEEAAQKRAYQANLRMYLLSAVVLFFIVLAIVLWRNTRQKQKANDLLKDQKEEIETQRDNLDEALNELKATQNQLVQREKMASLGELTAGIAHEIQNPLNFVNNFSEVNTELIGEMEVEIAQGHLDEVKAIAGDIKENQLKISQHGKRADFIVKGMLEHSRKSGGEKQPTNLNVLCDEFLKLSYHGLRARDKSFNAEMITHFDPKLPAINVSQQDMGRVMLNLFNNAFYAVNQKAKASRADYKPTVEVSTSVVNDQMVISVRDNGSGIPEAIKDKIMQPFFTTKPTGEGTGLGLSLSYDIVVKGHGGKIDVNTKEGELTEFIITLVL